MKKRITLSIVGFGVAATFAHGQGSMAFDTYRAQGSDGIITTYGNGPLAGQGINSTFTGALLWSVTDPHDVATTGSTSFEPLSPVWIVGSVGTFATSGATAGYITGPDLDINSAVGQNLFFEVVAFSGTGWDVGNPVGQYQGHSASFAATLVTGLNLPNADHLDNMAPFQVFQAIPEPTTMALGGLGLAALLVARRKKA